MFKNTFLNFHKYVLKMRENIIGFAPSSILSDGTTEMCFLTESFLIEELYSEDLTFLHRRYLL